MGRWGELELGLRLKLLYLFGWSAVFFLEVDFFCLKLGVEIRNFYFAIRLILSESIYLISENAVLLGDSEYFLSQSIVIFVELFYFLGHGSGLFEIGGGFGALQHLFYYLILFKDQFYQMLVLGFQQVDPFLQVFYFSLQEGVVFFMAGPLSRQLVVLLLESGLHLYLSAVYAQLVYFPLLLLDVAGFIGEELSPAFLGGRAILSHHLHLLLRRVVVVVAQNSIKLLDDSFDVAGDRGGSMQIGLLRTLHSSQILFRLHFFQRAQFFGGNEPNSSAGFQFV